jgi:mono/diheme cytochrome c family protein
MTRQIPSDNTIPWTPIVVFFGGIVLLLLALFANRPSTTAVTTTPVVIVQATAVQVAFVSLDAAKVKAGESIFQSVCAACHGFNAKGIPGLGKPLIGSQFANSLSDDDLLAFIQKGRPVTDPLNTTGVMMPPRGGNPSLKDDDLRNVIAYIRSLNGSQVAAVSPEQATAAALVPTLPPAEFHADAISALLGTSSQTSATSTPVPVTTANINSPGAADFVRACSGCHGINGAGQPMLTKPLPESTMLKSVNSIGILNLFTTAHPPSAEFQHPYRGGYPELSDNQLLGIITYLITLPK